MVLLRVHWSEARQAEPRRSSAPLRDATPDSALRYLRYIHSFTESDYCTINRMIPVRIRVPKVFRTMFDDLMVLPNG